MDFDEKKEPNKKISRKGKKPTRFKPGASTSRSVKTLETEKSKGKRIALETDSDVGQRKNNTFKEKPLVIKEPVFESTSRSVKTLETESKSKGKRICLESDSDVWEKKKNTCGEKHESMKNPSSCGLGLAGCVKVLRQMEFSEHIDKDFRQSFLSWYSLRADAKETIVARTFIHAFKDDLEALAEQLIDAFSESIAKSKKRSSTGDGDGASSSGALFKKPRHN